jgi:hypothetical protein
MVAINREVFRWGIPNFIQAKVVYSQAIKKGEMLKIAVATGLATPVSAASDNDTFFAIADQDHAALSADDSKAHAVRAIIPDPSCVYEYPVSGTPDLGVGVGLAISDSQTLVRTSTDHVCIAVEPKTAATLIKVVFLVPPIWGGASQNTSFDEV